MPSVGMQRDLNKSLNCLRWEVRQKEVESRNGVYRIVGVISLGEELTQNNTEIPQSACGTGESHAESPAQEAQ